MLGKNFSRTEMNIIKYLDSNGRTPFRKIGRMTRKSEQIVSYTVNNLRKSGVIKNFYTLLDYSRFGLLNFRVLFNINYVSEEEFRGLVNFLVNDPHTMWIISCGGRYDLMCTFAAPNPSYFNKVLRRIMSRFPSQIQNYVILTTIVTRMLGRHYLDRSRKRDPPMIVGGDRESLVLSAKDMRILAGIADDARKTSVEIGKSVGSSARTVINRIRALEELGVIKGYQTFLDLTETSISAYLMMIRYHNVPSEDDNAFIRYLESLPNVFCLTKALGKWDLEIRIEFTDQKDFRRIEREIRQNFSGLIQTTETFPIYKEYKKTFFPGFIMDIPERQ